MASDILIGGTIIAGILSAVCLYIGWKKRKLYQQLSEVDVTDIRQISDAETVELEGEIVDVDDPVEASLTDEKAAVVAWKVEEWDERGDHERWSEQARGIESSPFVLDDGTGQVRVDVGDLVETSGKWTSTGGVTASDGVRLDDVLAEFDSFSVEEEVGIKEETPEHVRRFEDRVDLRPASDSITNLVDVGNKHGDRRYYQQVIRPGEEAYVFGHAVENDDATHPLSPEDVTVEPVKDGDVFVVSNQDEESIEAEFKSSASLLLKAGTVGIALTVLLFAILLLTAL